MEIKNCPNCGGEIWVSELYQYSIDRKVKKSGEISNSFKKSDAGTMDCSIAACHKCGKTWEQDDFEIRDNMFFDLLEGNDG